MSTVLAPSLPANWKEKLKSVWSTPFFSDLQKFLEDEAKKGKTFFPASNHVFRALEALDLPKVKVVIFGQDPYHGLGQAIGLSFAVPNELKKKPPSLKNIFKEIESDLEVKLPAQDSDLSGWVEQGVLLLNRTLTVEESNPLSHQNRGWEKFTDVVIDVLNERKEPMVFILWGSHAQKLKARIDLSRHFVLESPHPSPLSAYRGFFGSKIFSKANSLLKKIGVKPIQWERISERGKSHD